MTPSASFGAFAGGISVRRSWLRLFWAGIVVGAVVVGYLVFSGQGKRLLHEEIETQLGRLLAGRVEIAEVGLYFDDGLRVEAHGLEAYPNPVAEGPPGLRASRVVAWVDLLAVLVGRLELSTLILDGPQIRIEQRADGSFVGLPLPPLPRLADTQTDDSMAERVVQWLQSLDPAAAAFDRQFRAADRIEIIDGAATWIDHRNPGADGTPRELRLELISGVSFRDWLSDAVDLEGRAVFLDGEHAPFPIKVGIHRSQGPHFEWTASASQIPLDAAESPLPFIEKSDLLAGTLDAKFVLSKSNTGTHRLVFEGIVEDARFRLRQSRSLVGQERVEIHTTIEFDDTHLRVTSGRIAGERLGLEFKGVLDRPIHPTSRTRIESRTVGAEIGDIHELARRFEAEFDMALAISRLTGRVEAGQIRYFGATGTDRLQRWIDLARGRTRDLPKGFLLDAGFDGILFRTDAGEAIEELTGEIEWAEDQISLRNMTGLYRGRSMPKLNATFDAVSHLIRASELVDPIQSAPPPLPGFSTLLDIFKPRDRNAPATLRAIGLAIDHIDHPILLLPLRDLRVLVEPRRQGGQANIREGTWGGAAIEGNLVWFSHPDSPTISAQIAFGPPPIEPPDESEEGKNPRPDQASIGNRWASGRFEMQFQPRPRLPFLRASGHFRFEDADLIGHEVEIELSPVGKAALRTKIDLRRPATIGLDLSFAITDANFAGMSEFVVLPPYLVTGDVGATGSIRGRVRPFRSFIAELKGSVRVEAKDGRIQTDMPLLLRLGKATEGYNPFANADELEYESMTGTLEINHGWLTVEDFEIEGPLRVYANARLDTNRPPGRIRAVVGVFLFRTPNQIFSNLPLLRSFLPGSEKGLIGAYFKVRGPVDEPDVEALPLKTLMSSVPDAIKAPFKAIRFLLGGDENDS